MRKHLPVAFFALACCGLAPEAGAAPAASPHDMQPVLRIERVAPTKESYRLELNPQPVEAVASASSVDPSLPAIPRIEGGPASAPAPVVSVVGQPAVVYSTMSQAAQAGVDPLQLREKTETLNADQSAAATADERSWLDIGRAEWERFMRLSPDGRVGYLKSRPAIPAAALACLVLGLVWLIRRRTRRG